jgi:spore maturation protein CgeB
MSFKLLSISSMYPGFLESFYTAHPETNKLSYEDHYNLLISDTTEFAGSYTRNFRKLGIDARCLVSNDDRLQNKWKVEFGVADQSDLLIEQILKYNPDILWIEHLAFINSEWFKVVREKCVSIKLIIAYHCAPYNAEILEKLKNFDFLFTCTPGLKQSFENEAIRTYLIYHGFDTDLLSRVDDQKPISNNLTFSGSLVTGGSFHNARISLIESLIKEKIDLSLYVTLEKSYKIRIKQFIHFIFNILKKFKMERLAEKIPYVDHGRSPVRNYSHSLLKLNHPPLYGIKMYNLFNRSKIVLNIHIGVAGDYAGNMRMFEVTGVGSCLLTDNKKNIHELFEIGTEVVVYDNTDDCIRKVKWLLEHDEEREKIAKAGQKKTLEMHTVENRCRTIIDIINAELEVASLRSQ